MKTEKINYKGFEAEIIYQPFFDDSTPKSQQYQLIIRQNEIELVKQYRFTYNKAVDTFKKYVDKQNCDKTL